MHHDPSNLGSLIPDPDPPKRKLQCVCIVATKFILCSRLFDRMHMRLYCFFFQELEVYVARAKWRNQDIFYSLGYFYSESRRISLGKQTVLFRQEFTQTYFSALHASVTFKLSVFIQTFYMPEMYYAFSMTNTTNVIQLTEHET